MLKNVGPTLAEWDGMKKKRWEGHFFVVGR